MNRNPSPSDRRTFTIGPSDLTFLFSECRRCFYLKIVLGLRRPTIPMSAVFTIFDREQKRYIAGKPIQELHDQLPAGMVLRSDMSVRSVPIPVPGSKVNIVFRGTLDTVLALEDASFGIIDLKTTEPKAGLADFYSPQLHAYALALENPALGWPLVKPVTLLGLVCFEPREMVRLADGALAYRTIPSWMPIPRDDSRFLSLLTLVAEILAATTLPRAAADCPWCAAVGWPRATDAAASCGDVVPTGLARGRGLGQREFGIRIDEDAP